MAARALAAMAGRDPVTIMHTVINQLVPALSDVRSDRIRCGAAETLSRVVDTLQLQVVPYIVLLVVPLMGRMSDHCEAVRVMSTRCFASLIQLMPLDGAIPEPAGLAPEMKARRARDKHFLEQLFNPKSIKDYKIPVPVSAELRSYQQAGVNWLRFLYEYKLHGVLCDDMGLGKTLQSIVVVAGSHWERANQREPALPSLVVCPPTLTGHWLFEVNKFIPTKFLKAIQYAGPPVERERLRGVVKCYNLVVASYDIVRKDIDFFSKIRWNYCVLDEGHVIKNGKTKAFKAIKQLVANHRLILSGTPIQNNVLELWSLFDFLMPGLLGTERQFTARYSRPILAARDPKATPHQLQAGALACEALHRQVLPFLLRRVKEDVLKELPPKITQDYYCELSPLQRRLYEHFSKHHMPQQVEHTSRHTHVFQALHYLQNVCNHPKLVLTGDHPEAASIRQQLAAQNSSLDDIEHSAKLPALKQLLLDCGIGTTSSETESELVVSQHRALIFCQLKKMLDIVEKDLLQKHLPAVTYLRLDGSVPPAQRHAIVTRFNSDVSIDCLLLTTQEMLYIVEKDLLQKHLPAVTYLRLDGSVPPAQRHAIVTRFNSDVSIDCLLLTTQEMLYIVEKDLLQKHLPAVTYLRLDGSVPPAQRHAIVTRFNSDVSIDCLLLTTQAMLDNVEKDLLQKHLPAVTYLRLDGSVPPAQRHAIVTRFNSDVSIDCLLLTTQVGGLGLNLTGADTVIFVEHDWNPMKDLQAMDRAHRIGQKKVVNVYRLVTRNTLEQKIMGLQKFKLLTANTVISSENAAMETMGTEQLLDLFQLSSTSAATTSLPSTSSSSSSAKPLETLPDLWDDKQYEKEYDMTSFIKGLNKMNSS
ncbi:hypothetical protein O0L34_g17931 [Tuta absoluta]|nr:hypothetical protein O0L34_g17931 [Tuta absoluta]KAJ2939740.1 hypothetical protein O0L34_g17931 [Tuta absoluta]